MTFSCVISFAMLLLLFVHIITSASPSQLNISMRSSTVSFPLLYKQYPSNIFSTVLSTTDRTIKSPIVGPPFHNMFGHHETRVYIGDPPKPANVIVDTGNTMLWVQSKPCISCYDQEGPLYNVAESITASDIDCASTTCEKLQSGRFCTSGLCSFNIVYTDKSKIVGELFSDKVTVADMAFQVNIGCSRQSSASFGKASGSMGLGAGALSFPVQIGAKWFSLCLADQYSYESTMLTFGLESDDDVNLTKDQQVITNLLQDQKYVGYHFVDGLIGISVGGEMLNFQQEEFSMEQGGVIIDTGSLMSKLPPVIFQALRETMETKILFGIPRITYLVYDTCYEIHDMNIKDMSPIEFHFVSGQKLQFLWSNIMLDMGSFTFCLALTPTVDGPNIYTVLGSLLLRRTRLTFNLLHSWIGFSSNQC